MVESSELFFKWLARDVKRPCYIPSSSSTHLKFPHHVASQSNLAIHPVTKSKQLLYLTYLTVLETSFKMSQMMHISLNHPNTQNVLLPLKPNIGSWLKLWVRTNQPLLLLTMHLCGQQGEDVVESYVLCYSEKPKKHLSSYWFVHLHVSFIQFLRNVVLFERRVNKIQVNMERVNSLESVRDRSLASLTRTKQWKQALNVLTH